jgi:glycine cleavage system H protein
MPAAAVQQVNAEPYKGGWIMKLKVSNKADMDALLDADAYTKHCDE